MLQSLHVKNIALIDDVEIDFTDGLNILTGETGAGKSIIIDSVNFALGARMPKDVVRSDSDYALCELVFSIDDEKTRSELEKLDVMLTDDQVILQRRIVNGKAGCKVNGESVPASRIRDIAGYLIDIHGQHEHQSLLYKKNHKLLLDSFCKDGFNDELCKLSDLYDEYKAAKEEFERAQASRDSVAQDLDYSRFVAGEIEAAALRDGEDEELENDFSRMNNSRKIAEILSQVMRVLSSDAEGASSMLGYALSSLRQVADIDEDARPLYEQLTQAEDVLSDSIRALSSYEESLEYSPEEYERTKERLDVINSLKMKYGQTIDKINERLARESETIEKLSDYESYLKELEFKSEELYGKLLNVCSYVSDIRKKEAKVLQKEITGALGSLNFLDAKFEIKITSDENSISRDGYDDVEFMISTNPGEELKPLTSVASGGELSRIMLAIKTVFVEHDEIETMIFDENDVGTSGRTAQMVAEKMAVIAKSHQVICISHLAQIAAMADTGFVIEKVSEKGHTNSAIRRLNEEEAIEEIARILGGAKITEAVRNSAREMKELANGLKEKNR